MIQNASKLLLMIDLRFLAIIVGFWIDTSTSFLDLFKPKLRCGTTKSNKIWIKKLFNKKNIQFLSNFDKLCQSLNRFCTLFKVNSSDI